MVSIRIDYERCKGCLNCVEVCNAPGKVYTVSDGKPVPSRPENCIECLQCAFLCPAQAIIFDDVYLSRIVLYEKEHVKIFDKLY